MQTLKPTVLWLTACVLLTCHGRQGTQCLAAAITAVIGSRGPGQPMGIIFPSVEAQEPVMSDTDYWEHKRLVRLDEPEDNANSFKKPLTEEDLLRRIKLDELLWEVSRFIPPPPAKRRANKRLANGLKLPIRSGRTSPSGIQSAQTENAGQSAGSNGQISIALPVMTDGREYQGPPKRMRVPSASMRQNSNEAPRVNDMSDIYQPTSHRSGSVEFAIQTPLHTQSAARPGYGTKRVENSRGWNNLRGMWGKRSDIPPMGARVGRPPSSIDEPVAPDQQVAAVEEQSSSTQLISPSERNEFGL